MSNHDNSRIASRLGKAQACVAAFIMLTSKGTPIIYYGDEIGMHNAAIPQDQIKDRAEQARDPERTPMQWSSQPYAGFTLGQPWLDVCDDYETVNVEAQKNDPDSLLHLYKDLISLRKQEPVLVEGAFIPVGLQGHVFAFMRKCESSGTAFLIVCNLSHSPAIFEIPPFFSMTGRIIYGTCKNRKEEKVGKIIKLTSDEAFIAKVEEE